MHLQWYKISINPEDIPEENYILNSFAGRYFDYDLQGDFIFYKSIKSFHTEFYICISGNPVFISDLLEKYNALNVSAPDFSELLHLFGREMKEQEVK